MSGIIFVEIHQDDRLSMSDEIPLSDPVKFIYLSGGRADKHCCLFNTLYMYCIG